MLKFFINYMTQYCKYDFLEFISNNTNTTRGLIPNTADIIIKGVWKPGHFWLNQLIHTKLYFLMYSVKFVI